ncbi:MAG: DUF4384 domain-containing protein [Candidatus Tectimicrobiota bacterium]
MYPRRRFLAWGAMAAVTVPGVLEWAGQGVAQGQSDENIHFLWLFEAREKRQPGDRVEHFAITQDTELKLGDQLRMALELRKPCYVYVLYHSAQGELQQLFPYEQGKFEQDHALDKRYLIPAGEDMWFTLNGKTGQETFYLLASTKRLIDLETLLAAHSAAAAAERAPLVSQTLAAIRKLKRQHRQLASPAERPIPIAGNMRHDVKPTEVRAQDFYSKTFTLDTTA